LESSFFKQTPSLGSLHKRGASQPIMHQTPTPNLGQEVLVSPLGSSNPNSSQSSEVDFILLIEQNGIFVKGENEVIQQQSPSHTFHKTCCTPH